MADVRVGGVWLRSLGHVAAVKWSSRWGTGPCGPDLASCTVAVDSANSSALLRVGSPFEVWEEGVLVFGGVISEMGRDFPRTIAARGWARRAEDFDAVGSGGVGPTSNPDLAVSSAMARGLQWVARSGFTDAPLGGGDPVPVRLDALLNEWSVTAAQRWGVDARGVAFAVPEPTTVDYFLDASDLDIGVADDGLFTRVRARYVSGVDGTSGEANDWSSVVVDDDAGIEMFGAIEYLMDLTSLGLLDGSTAGDYAVAQLNLLTKPQWLSRVVTTAGRLLTPGGLPADLPSVRAGQVVRLFNVPTTLGGLRAELGMDVVLGEVEYDTEAPSRVTLAPVNLAVRNLADALAQASRRAA